MSLGDKTPIVAFSHLVLTSEDSNMSSPIMMLPLEMLRRIFSYLDTRELLDSCLVCHSWLKMIRQDSTLVQPLKVKNVLQLPTLLDLWPNVKVLELNGAEFKSKLAMFSAEVQASLFSRKIILDVRTLEDYQMPGLKFDKIMFHNACDEEGKGRHELEASDPLLFKTLQIIDRFHNLKDLDVLELNSLMGSEILHNETVMPSLKKFSVFVANLSKFIFEMALMKDMSGGCANITTSCFSSKVLAVTLLGVGMDTIDAFSKDNTLLLLRANFYKNLESLNVLDLENDLTFYGLLREERWFPKLKHLSMSPNFIDFQLTRFRQFAKLEGLPILNISSLCLSLSIDDLEDNIRMFDIFSNKCPKLGRLEIYVRVHGSKEDLPGKLMALLNMLKTNFARVSHLEMGVSLFWDQFEEKDMNIIMDTFNNLNDALVGELSESCTFKLRFLADKEHQLVKYPMRPPKIEGK